MPTARARASCWTTWCGRGRGLLLGGGRRRAGRAASTPGGRATGVARSDLSFSPPCFPSSRQPYPKQHPPFARFASSPIPLRHVLRPAHALALALARLPLGRRRQLVGRQRQAGQAGQEGQGQGRRPSCCRRRRAVVVDGCCCWWGAHGRARLLVGRGRLGPPAGRGARPAHQAPSVPSLPCSSPACASGATAACVVLQADRPPLAPFSWNVSRVQRPRLHPDGPHQARPPAALQPVPGLARVGIGEPVPGARPARPGREHDGQGRRRPRPAQPAPHRARGREPDGLWPGLRASLPSPRTRLALRRHSS